jgi:hypothetical protein
MSTRVVFISLIKVKGEMTMMASKSNLSIKCRKMSIPQLRHHPNFFAYFPTANSYAGVIGDILSTGIAAIGFSWVSRQLI